LGLLASGLKHHLRNALGAIRAFLDLTPDANIDVERVGDPKYWLAFYKTAQLRMRKITEILDSLGSVRITPVATFNDQVKLSEVAMEVAKSRGRQVVQVHASGSERPVQVDKRMFCRMFELLFENLSSASAEGAVLHVVITEDSQSGDVKLEFWADELRLPKEVLRYVFDPFYAQDTTPNDSGINLLFCYFIVHHHGGQLIATADESDITRYMISLPREQGAATNIKDDEEFLQKVFAAEEAWEHLLTS